MWTLMTRRWPTGQGSLSLFHGRPAGKGPRARASRGTGSLGTQACWVGHRGRASVPEAWHWQPPLGAGS